MKNESSFPLYIHGIIDLNSKVQQNNLLKYVSKMVHATWQTKEHQHVQLI